MESLWSGTDSGLSKDWDDEFDDTETPITYEFPYSELASQSGVPPVVCPSKSASSENAVTISEEFKDGNILKSRKTYSTERKNPLFTDYEVSQGKKRKEVDSFLEFGKTKNKNPRMEQQKKKSQDKNLSVENRNHSKVNDNLTKNAEVTVTLNNFSEKGLVNGVKGRSVHSEELNLTSEYSLFGDIDGLSSVNQVAESTTKCAEDRGHLCKETLNTGYQRTRKNLRQQINSKIIQNEEIIEKGDSVVNATNNELAPNTNGSKSALEIKVERQCSWSLNPSGSEEEDEVLNFQPPPPKKQLSLMDMVKKYSEIQNSDQNKNTSTRKKRPTLKSQNSKTVRTTSAKLSIHSNDKKCNNLGDFVSSSPLQNSESSQNNKRPSNVLVKNSHTLKRNPKETSVNNNIPKVYPVSQLSCKINNGLQSINQSTVNSKKSVKGGKATPKKRQRKTQKPNSVPCSKTKCKPGADTLSYKHAQSSVSGSIVSQESSFHSLSPSRTLPILNSSICNRVVNNTSLSGTKTTENLTSFPLNSGISQNSQTVTGYQLLHQKNTTLVPASSPSSSDNISMKPVVSAPSSTMAVSNKTKINLTVHDVLEQSSVGHNFEMNPSASVHYHQSKESDSSDSESDTPAMNHRTFSLLGADFFCHMVSKMDSISKSCAVQCLEAAEDWIAETPYSRVLTVKEFCNNPLVMNVLLEFLNGYPDADKLPKQDNGSKVFYEFPEDFQNVPLFRMLKDYVDQVLLQMVPPNFSPNLSISSQSVLEFAFSKMPFRECAIMSLLFSKRTEVLKLADVAAKLNFVAMLVIFEEFRQREIEG